MRLYFTSHFRRAVKQHCKKNPQLKTRIENQINFFRENILYPSLRIHKLKGKRSDQMAFWIEGNLRIGDVLYQGSIGIIEARFGAYKKYLPAIFALAVFAAFRTLFIMLGWISVAISWIAFKILLYAGVVKIFTRTMPQEYVEFN